MADAPAEPAAPAAPPRKNVSPWLWLLLAAWLLWLGGLAWMGHAEWGKKRPADLPERPLTLDPAAK